MLHISYFRFLVNRRQGMNHPESTYIVQELYILAHILFILCREHMQFSYSYTFPRIQAGVVSTVK